MKCEAVRKLFSDYLKDAADMNFFEFFLKAAFNFTEYFEKIITL